VSLQIFGPFSNPRLPI